MNPARPAPTDDRNPRDYQPNRAQANQPEEIVLHSHVGAKIMKFRAGVWVRSVIIRP
jgi:hypothetical protein